MDRAIYRVGTIAALLALPACGSNGSNNSTGGDGGTGGGGGSSGDGGTAVCPGSAPEGPFPFASLSLVAGQIGGPGNTDGTFDAVRLDAGVDQSPDSARLVTPTGIAFDGYGAFYVADGSQGTIRKQNNVEGSLGVTTLAGVSGQYGIVDGVGCAARFDNPLAVAWDGQGHLFVADNAREGEGDVIREVDVATGAVTTIAGSPTQQGSADGAGAAALFNGPSGVAWDGAGHLYIADTGNATIRELTVATGAVTTVAGTAGETGQVDGTGAAVRFSDPSGLAWDGQGHLYIGDSAAIRALDVASGAVTTLAGSPDDETGGTDGVGPAARFEGTPAGLTFDGQGHLYVSDSKAIREVDVASGAVTTTAGNSTDFGSTDGTGAAAEFSVTKGVAFEAYGSTATTAGGGLLVADSNNGAVRVVVVSPGTPQPSTLVSTVMGLAAHPGDADATGLAASFSQPSGLAWDGVGTIFVADVNNNAIRAVATSTSTVTTLAGGPNNLPATDGSGSAAGFAKPSGVAFDGAGHLFVADSLDNEIRAIDVASKTVSTLAGSNSASGVTNGTGKAASFNNPTSVAYDGQGHLYVAEAGTGADVDIREIDVASAAVTTLVDMSQTEGAGATGAYAAWPWGLVYDGAGHLFLADTYNSTVQQIDVATRSATVLAGATGVQGTQDGTGGAARFQFPQGLAWDGAGHLYVSDAAAVDIAAPGTATATIRQVTVATGAVVTIAGVPNQIGVQTGQAPARLNAPAGLAWAGSQGLFVSDAVENVVLLLH